jgi:hypothetical protein
MSIGWPEATGRTRRERPFDRVGAKPRIVLAPSGRREFLLALAKEREQTGVAMQLAILQRKAGPNAIAMAPLVSCCGRKDSIYQSVGVPCHHFPVTRVKALPPLDWLVSASAVSVPELSPVVNE